MRICLGKSASSSRSTPNVGVNGRQFTRRYKLLTLAILFTTSLVGGSPSVWSQIDQEFSEDSSSDLKHCRDLVSSGQFDEARREITELLGKDPDSAEAYEILGISYLKQGDYAQAETALRKASDIAPNNSSVLNNLGNALYRQNKLPESIDVYKRAVTLPNSESFRLWTNLANAYADQGTQSSTDEAIKAFARAIKLKSDFAPAYLGIGRMYCEREQFDQADKHLRLAIKYKPDYSGAYYYLGHVEAGRKNFPEAIAYLTKSQKYEHNAQYRAETSKQIDKLKDDMRSSKTQTLPAAVSTATPTGHGMSSALVESNVGGGKPDTKEIALKRVNQLLMKRNWPAAQRDLEIILNHWGDDPVVWNNLGYARVHQGEGGSSQAYLDAIDDYKKAIKLRQGGFSAAQYNLGQAYRLLDSHRFAREAEDAFRQSIADAEADNKPCPLAHNALGLMQKQRGDLSGAEQSYKLAIMQAGTDLPVAHYNRALLLEKTAQSRIAVQEYKAYLKLEPRGHTAEKARIHLKQLGVDPPTG